MSKVEEEAEECFQRAIEDRAQATERSRWNCAQRQAWPDCGSNRASRKKLTQLLSEIYGWFTEGFDTKDLQEAKTMLEELT